MKKEPLFFTEKTEIGAQHVPIDSNKFAKGGLIAPNGKPSNLSPKLYEIVRTPEFKAWFGDWENDPQNASKVVDSNGEPLVVYHGTNQDFSTFDLKTAGKRFNEEHNTTSDSGDYGMWGVGFYFSPIKKFSQHYGSKVMKLFLNIRNPFVRDPNITGTDSEFQPARGKEASLKLREEILSKGYDGVIHIERSQKEPAPIMQIVSFYPNQIKLSDGKNTTFDGSNPDIRFKDGGSIDNERIVCENCGWSWKVEDGGDDLYECHKCDHDNTPNSFMKWYIDWYKGISDKMVITMSLPNIIAPFKEKNVVILDVFEKKDQNIDAKPYLKKIVEKADEYGVVIYLEPQPRTDSLLEYYERFGFELTPNKQFMKRIPHFAGGGGIDINEPFNVNGKTLAERVRILVKQLYPDYKWSITSSYNKLDVYLLEADFDPFTDKWREEYPTRELYYNVDNRDFEDYNRQYNAKITDRAVEVFKPIREYIDKFVYNRNADDPYADYSDYNVYEYTYIGKWDKPYKQVEPKAGKKKPKAPVTPTVNTPPTNPPFKVGDIVAVSKKGLGKLPKAIDLVQNYYEISRTGKNFTELNEYDSQNQQTYLKIELDLLENYVKATIPLFKTGDTVVKRLFPNNPKKVTHRAFYQQIAVKCSTPEKKFLLSGMYWNYHLENGEYADENELELYNAMPSTAPKFKVGDIITYRSTQDKKYTVIEFIEFDNEIQENIYRIESLSDKLTGTAKESMMALVEPTTSSDNPFMIQNIVSKTQWSEGLKKTMIEDFVNSGYENVTPLIGDRADNTSNNIQKKVDGFSSGKNTYLQADYLADLIHALIDAGNTPIPATTPNTEKTFIDYLNANNEKANEISKELEVTTSLAMFVMGSKDIANLDSKKYAELMEEFLSKFPKLIEDDGTNAN